MATVQVTRRRILELLLSRQGRLGVEGLAQHLGLAPITVRHHLGILEHEGLIQVDKVHQKVGRPRYEYSLTELGQEAFPKQYDRLSSLMVEETKARLGEEMLVELFRSLGLRWAQEATHGMPVADFRERLDRAVEELGRGGYMAEWRQTEEGYFIYLRNCPYLQVAREHEVLCEMDTQLIGGLMASPAELEGRVIEGHANCTYHIKLA